MSRLMSAVACASLLSVWGCHGDGRVPVLPPGSDAGGADAGEIDAGELDAGCMPGTHPCAGGCKSNMDLATCGDACTACPTPANGTPTCDGKSCGFTCNPGSHLCAGACVTEDGESCGPSCAKCPAAAPHAYNICENNQCAVGCSGDFTTCASGACGHPAGDSCNVGDDCCGAHCEAHQCCLALGSSCDADPDCVTFHCTGQNNLKCGPSKQCCLPAGATCVNQGDCCSGQCDSTIPGLFFCKNG
jgi:hypothetical protein